MPETKSTTTAATPATPATPTTPKTTKTTTGEPTPLRKVEDPTDVCLITKDALRHIIGENAHLQKLSIEVSDNIRKIMESFSTNILQVLQQQNQFMSNLTTKIDNLANTIATNGSLDGISIKFDSLKESIDNHDHMETFMDTFNSNFQRLIDITNKPNSLEGICSKLDSLTEAVSNHEHMDTFNTNLERLINTISAHHPPPTDGAVATSQPEATSTREELDLKIVARKEYTEKIIRSELLSDLYTTNIEDEEKPFAPANFRAKVNKNTPEHERVHRRQQTISSVHTEIQILNDRIKDWTQKISSIDIEIEQFLSSHEILRQPTMEDIEKHASDFHTKFTNGNLKKMQDDFAAQKTKDSDFLLKIVDDSSKNMKGHTQQYRGGGRHKGRGKF